MADKQYRSGWPADQVALPDTSSEWTLSKAFQQYADRVVPDATLENSALNMFLDKKTMADIDWTGARDRANAGPGIYTGLQPYTPDPRSPIQAGNISVPQVDAHAKPGWVQLPQPGEMEAGEHGAGYYTYGTAPGGRPGPEGQWGDPRTGARIAAVADRLAMGQQPTPFGVGNISLPGGGRFKGHKEHRDGLDIDVRPARTDGAHMPVTYKDPHYDRAATQRLIDAFRATGQVGAIYFNDPEVHGVQPSKDHDNHLHVKLNR